MENYVFIWHEPEYQEEMGCFIKKENQEIVVGESFILMPVGWISHAMILLVIKRHDMADVQRPG